MTEARLAIGNVMTKEAFADYTALKHGTASLDEAVSELSREADVRRRIYDRWVSEGRLSWIDARDRLTRHLTALGILVEAATIATLKEKVAAREADVENHVLRFDPNEHTEKVLDVEGQANT